MTFDKLPFLCFFTGIFTSFVISKIANFIYLTTGIYNHDKKFQH